jgi:predicted nucleic acid-binding protein
VTVIDTSAFARLALREPGWEEVVPFLREQPKPMTVEMLRVEILNALWKSVRLGLIDSETARSIEREVARLFERQVIGIEPNAAYAAQALEIACEHTLAVFDALFIAQAARHDTRLLTADRRQADVASTIGLRVHRL